MPLITQKDRQAFLYLSLVIMGMILLGVSLPSLRFQAGLPFPGADPASINEPVGKPGFSKSASPLLLPYGLALGIILLFISLIIALLKKVNTKRICLLAAALVLLFVFFSVLPDLAPSQADSNPDNISAVPPQSFDYIVAPIGEPPTILVVWVIAGLLLVSVALISWSVSHAFHWAKKEDELAKETEAAIQAILDGHNFNDVIIHCYLRMESVIALERGIERSRSVTPREFETYLVEKGIPRTPILQLTSVFEKARYSNQNLDQQEEQDAINSLIAIQKACQLDSRGNQ
jgi:hypothetical protein